MEALRNALDFSDFPRIDLIVAGVVATFLVAFPLTPHSSFAMATMIQFLMFSLYGMGWNTIGGYGGQVDLGKAQYLGIGAFTTAVMLIRWDIPFWVSMPIGVALAVAWSFIIGYPLFRLTGHYFAIATLGVAEATREIVADDLGFLFEVPARLFKALGASGVAEALENLADRVLPVTNGPTGITLPFFRPGIQIGDLTPMQIEGFFFYYLTLLLMVLAVFLTWRLTKSKLGYSLVAIREDEDSANMLGINTTRSKVMAFALCAFLIGLVGGINAYWKTFVLPEEVFKIGTTLEMILSTILGGPGTILGPVIGAGIFDLVSSLLIFKLNLGQFHVTILGLFIVLVIVFMPKGLGEFLSGKKPLSISSLLENIREYRV